MQALQVPLTGEARSAMRFGELFCTVQKCTVDGHLHLLQSVSLAVSHSCIDASDHVIRRIIG